MPNPQDRHIRNSVILIQFFLQCIHIQLLSLLLFYYYYRVPLFLCWCIWYELYRNVEPTAFFGFASLVCIKDYLHEDFVDFFSWLLTFSALLGVLSAPTHFFSALYTIVLLKQTLFFYCPSWTIASMFYFLPFLSFS